MTNGSGIPPLSAGEKLARFITVERWVRADQTLRQDAFIPPKDLNFSVTRHLNSSEGQLWKIGQKVADAIAAKRNASLYGRADITVGRVLGLHLKTTAAPLHENPGHAQITGWPPDKPAQKSIAQQLAAIARYIPLPIVGHSDG